MKRLLVVLFLAVVLHAETPDDIDVRIWSRILNDLSLKEYRLYTADPNLRAILCRIPGVILTDDCKKATLILDTRNHVVEEPACHVIPHLTNDYRTLLNNPDEIGAFFWLKGRPTIIFFKERLERFGLEVAPELRDYVEEQDG